MSNCTQQVLEIWVQGIAAVSSAGAIGVLGFVSVLLLWKKCIADNFRSFVDTVLLSFGAGAMLGDAVLPPPPAPACIQAADLNK
jgi:hypothetical protein